MLSRVFAAGFHFGLGLGSLRIAKRVSMDYDKIVKNRRRNWDALKPKEARKREEEEAREQRREEREKAGTVTKTERLKKKKEVEETKEKAEYKKATRDAAILIGCFVAFMIVVIIVERTYSRWRIEGWQDSLSSFSQSIASGEDVEDLSDPIGALSTWRSAWIDGDMEKLVGMFSSKYLSKVTVRNSYDQTVGEYKTRFAAGGFPNAIATAQIFGYPDIVHIPSKPWSEEDLAIFRSPEVQFTDEADPHTYTIAFSWNPQYNEWRFADMRRSDYFNVKWRRESAITAAKAGPNAVRYDLEGNRVN